MNIRIIIFVKLNVHDIVEVILNRMRTRNNFNYRIIIFANVSESVTPFSGLNNKSQRVTYSGSFE